MVFGWQQGRETLPIAVYNHYVAGDLRAAGGLETAGYCRTSRTVAAFTNSLGQSVEGAFTEAALDTIARARGRAGTAPADLGGNHERLPLLVRKPARSVKRSPRHAEKD